MAATDTLENALGSIAEYARAHALTGEQLGMIFDAGLAATSQLRPDIVPSVTDCAK